MIGRQSMMVVALAVLIAVGGSMAQASDVPVPSSRKIEYHDDRLTVVAQQVPLEVVLREIAGRAGAELRGAPREPREVTADFENVPISEGLRRLLGEQNFTLTYGEGGLKRIWLKGGPLTAGKAPGVGAPPPPAPGVPSVSAEDILAMFERTVTVPPGRVADTVGGNQATYHQLAQLATTTDDASLRAEAIRIGMMGLENDAEMKGAVATHLQAINDQALADVVRSAAGDRARDVMLQVMAHSRSPEIRNKATVLMRQFRVNQPKP